MSLTLKSAKQETFENAYYMLQSEIVSEFDRHRKFLVGDADCLKQPEGDDN